MDTGKSVPFGRRDCAVYAAGQIGQDLSFGLKSFMVIFWTQFMGLNASFFALLLMVVQVWDAINDPIIGSFVDSDVRAYKRSKYLRYMSVSSVGLMLSASLCFLPVPHAPQAAKAVLFVSGYLLWDAFYSLSAISMGSLLSWVAPNGRDRSTLSVARSFGSVTASMLPMIFIPMLVYDQANNLDGYRLFAVAVGMGMLSFGLIRFMVRSTVIRCESAHRRVGSLKIGFWQSVGLYLKNRAMLAMTLAAMANYVSLNALNVASSVLFQSYFRNARLSGLVLAVGIIPVYLLTPFMGRIAARYGKKEVIMPGLFVGMMVYLLELVIPMPPNVMGICVYFTCSFLGMFCRGFYLTLQWSMVGDAVDYGEWQYGERREGVMYAMFAFFGKMSQSLAPSIVLLIMVALGYVETNQANQTFEFALRMRYFVPTMSAFVLGVQWISIALVYNLDRQKVSEIRDALGQ